MVVRAATAAAMVAVTLIALTHALPNGRDREPAAESSTISAAGAPDEVRALDVAVDWRARQCPGASEPENILVGLELATGGDYRLAYPKMGTSPELDVADGPVAMIVYADGYPGGMWLSPDSIPTEGRRPEAGTVDICAVLPDDERVVYLDIPLEGFVAP